MTNREEVLAACDPAVAEFFRHVLSKAERRGHPIAWGSAGFSLGIFDSENDRRIAYGFFYPAGRLEFYVEYLHRYGLLDAAGEAELRRRLVALGELFETGKYTLKAILDERNAEAMKPIFDHVADEMEQLLASLSERATPE